MLNLEKIRILLEEGKQRHGLWVGPPARDFDLKQFTMRTDIVLPDEFCAWLKVANGVMTGEPLYGIRPRKRFLDLESHYDSWPSWREKKWLPVAGDGCGNRYIIPTAQEYGPGYPVLFIDMASPDKPAYIAASDLGHFLVFLLEDDVFDTGISWPCDKAYVMRADPDIARFTSLPRCWEA